MELFNLISVLIGLLVFIVLANTPWGFWRGKPKEEFINCCPRFVQLQEDKGLMTNNFDYCPYCGRSAKFSPDLKSAEKTVETIWTNLYTGKISDQTLRDQVQQALDYHPRIVQLIERRNNSPIRSQLEESAVEIDDWIQHVYDLALKLEHHNDELATIERDKAQAEKRLAKLQKKQADEADIQDSIEVVEKHIGSIDSLTATMERARQRLDHTVGALGTIYSQTMLIGAKEIDGAEAKRLQHGVHDEVLALDELLSALRDVAK